MDWESSQLLLLAPVLLGLLFWFDARTTHPMSLQRRRMLLVIRALLVVLALIAWASPAWVTKSARQAVVFVMDHSQSQGAKGLEEVYTRTKMMRERLPGDVPVAYVAAGAKAVMLEEPFADDDEETGGGREALMDEIGAQTDLAGAVSFAEGLFPAGASRHVVLVSDGLETRGRLEKTAREAAVSDVRIHAVSVSGEKRADVRGGAIGEQPGAIERRRQPAIDSDGGEFARRQRHDPVVRERPGGGFAGA